jgi:glucose-1-phosphate thymidylyltransferase
VSTTKRKGIILAGGSGTRLHPATLAVSKQLLPVYDKPMVYYPLSTLMLAGIRDILLISTPQDTPRFEQLLGDGSAMGPEPALRRAAQPRRAGAGLPDRARLRRQRPCAWCWATTSSTATTCRRCCSAPTRAHGASVFAYHVTDPERYGVVSSTRRARASPSRKSPRQPKSPYAVTGLYFYDARCATWPRAQAQPARRAGDHRPQRALPGAGALNVSDHGPRLRLAGHRHARQPAGGRPVHRHAREAPGPEGGLPRGDRLAQGWIDAEQLLRLAAPLAKTQYGQYLQRLVGAPA